MNFYKINPIKAGTVSYIQNKDPIFTIDIISRDEVLFFDSELYPELMISKNLYNKLTKEKFSGYDFPTFNKIFSIQHEIDHPNKRIPDWVRMMPYRNIENKYLDLYLNNDNEIIISEKFKNFLTENSRVKRCDFEKVNEENISIEEKIEEKPVFKQEKEKPLISILVVTIIVGIIGYLIF